MIHDPPFYPNAAGFKEHATSRDAADKIEHSGRAKCLRDKVLDFFACGHSATADETAQELGEGILAVRPRLAELNKRGLIEKTGQRRKSSTGTASHVWRFARS